MVLGIETLDSITSIAAILIVFIVMIAPPIIALIFAFFEVCKGNVRNLSIYLRRCLPVTIIASASFGSMGIWAAVEVASIESIIPLVSAFILFVATVLAFISPIIAKKAAIACVLNCTTLYPLFSCAWRNHGSGLNMLLVSLVLAVVYVLMFIVLGIGSAVSLVDCKTKTSDVVKEETNGE